VSLQGPSPSSVGSVNRPSSLTGVSYRKGISIVDTDDGNWFRVTGHGGASGASVWVQGALLMVTGIERFGLECQRLYDGKADRATIETFEPTQYQRLVGTSLS